MNSGFDKFQELEDRIVRTIELVKTTRQERTNAEKELSAARSQIKTLEREIDQLRHERDLVKDKVESLLETLSVLTEESVV
jgi:chromosome segregation ATPase